jgi:hypothetical protein
VAWAVDPATECTWGERWDAAHARLNTTWEAARQLQKRKLACPLITAEIRHWSGEIAALREEVLEGLRLALNDPAVTPMVVARMRQRWPGKNRNCFTEDEMDYLFELLLGPEFPDHLNRCLPVDQHRYRRGWRNWGRSKKREWGRPSNASAHALAGVERPVVHIRWVTVTKRGYTEMVAVVDAPPPGSPLAEVLAPDLRLQAELLAQHPDLATGPLRDPVSGKYAALRTNRSRPLGSA